MNTNPWPDRISDTIFLLRSCISTWSPNGSCSSTLQRNPQVSPENSPAQLKGLSLDLAWGSLQHSSLQASSCGLKHMMCPHRGEKCPSPPFFYVFLTSCLQIARLDLGVFKCLIRRTQSRTDLALHKFPRSKLYLYCKPDFSGSALATTSLGCFFSKSWSWWRGTGRLWLNIPAALGREGLSYWQKNFPRANCWLKPLS